MTLELQLGGKTPQIFQCPDCERPDLFKTNQANGQLNGDWAGKRKAYSAKSVVAENPPCARWLCLFLSYHQFLVGRLPS
jgi:hypothetical protein